tara:strand:+ start:2263 stop:2460 length:198 start_codon:yes stop_codon:yes gene_type:complete
MKYPVIIGYILLSIAAIYFLTKPSFKLVSECCKYEYRELPKRNGYDMMCLNCKKWCDLIETQNIK